MWDDLGGATAQAAKNMKVQGLAAYNWGPSPLEINNAVPAEESQQWERWWRYCGRGRGLPRVLVAWHAGAATVVVQGLRALGWTVIVFGTRLRPESGRGRGSAAWARRRVRAAGACRGSWASPTQSS